MNKDIKNVLITFSCIAVMLYGSSYVYSRKVIADEAKEQIARIQQKKELEAMEALQIQFLKINAEQERLLASQKLEEENLQKAKAQKEAIAKAQLQTKQPTLTQSVVANNTVSQQDSIAAQEAALARQKEADALLKQQIADAKAAAEKLAQQQAAAALAVKKSRKSSAS